MSTENDIIQVVCRHLDVDSAQVFSASRKQDVSEARQIAMYFIKKYTSYSYPRIGRQFNRTHAPVIYACKIVKSVCEVDAGYKTMVEEIDLLIQKAIYMVMAVSEEFNTGFWCAVQEFCAQGASSSRIEEVIRAAGFTYEECMKLMDESDFERDKLEPIVEEMFE